MMQHMMNRNQPGMMNMPGLNDQSAQLNMMGGFGPNPNMMGNPGMAMAGQMGQNYNQNMGGQMNPNDNKQVS